MPPLLEYHQPKTGNMERSDFALLSAGMAVAAGYYLYQLKATGDALETVSDVRLLSLKAERAVLQARVKLINKGTTSLRIDNPTVDLVYMQPDSREQSILKSREKAQTLIIHPGETSDFSLELETLSRSELFSLLGQTRFLELLGRGLNFKMRTRARVNFFIPIDETEIINLRLFK